MTEERKRLCIVIWVAAVCAAVLFIGARGQYLLEKAAVEAQAKLESDYAMALDHLSRNETENALRYFADTAGYGDTDTLVACIHAVNVYDPGDSSTYDEAYGYCSSIPDGYAGPYAEDALLMKEDVTEHKIANDAAQHERDRAQRAQAQRSSLPAASSPPKYTTRKKPSRTSDPDPYNASDYSDPEDFYYDYYDDFWEFEEAEEYWNAYS